MRLVALGETVPADTTVTSGCTDWLRVHAGSATPASAMITARARNPSRSVIARLVVWRVRPPPGPQEDSWVHVRWQRRWSAASRAIVVGRLAPRHPLCDAPRPP